MDKAANYTRSNSITTIPNLTISSKTQALYRIYREVNAITETMLQTLSDSILADLGLRTLNITFAGRRPHSRNTSRITKETHGVHSGNMLHQSIRIYKLTAAKQQLVSAKSAISTLLHEINHNIDLHIIKVNSIHSKGFYLRLKHLTIAMG
jgi:hypothetical protein